MQALKIGPALVYLRERRVFVDGVEQRLGGRAFDLLLALLHSADRVAGRDELVDRVWAHVAVEPNNLAVQVLALRRLLGPGAVLTVPRRGYRLVAPVSPAPAPGPAGWPPAGDRPALAALAQWVADHLRRERWVTLAGGQAPLQSALADAVAELHHQAGGGSAWHLNGPDLPDDTLRRRLARGPALLLLRLPRADAGRRGALAAWLQGVPAGSALRVLALAASPLEPLAGETVLPWPGLGPGETPAPPPTQAAGTHPMRQCTRHSVGGKAF